jgi:hypothetical protein
LKKPTWIGTGGVLPEKYGDFLLDFVLVLSNNVAVIKAPKNHRFAIIITADHFLN